MIRYTIACVLAAVAGCQLSQAQTEVQYTAGAGERNVVQSDGVTAVPDGNFVEVGYFDSGSGFNPASSGSNLSALGAHWHEYGFANIRTFGVGPETPVPGRFTGDSTQSPPNASSFNGQQIYLWIFQTTGNGAPASDFSNVNEYGIFSSTSTSPSITAAWHFPIDGTSPPGNLTQLSSNDVDTFVFGGSVAGSPGSLELANVVVVPEPSAISLLGVGLVIGRLFARRKS